MATTDAERDVEVVRYTYRLRPGQQAERALVREAGRCRWVWNRCVAADRDAAGGDRPTGVSLDRALTGWRAEHDWLSKGSSVVQKQAVRDWWQARRDAIRIKGRRRPRFKSKRRALPALNYTRQGFRLREDASGLLRLHLAGGARIPVVWSRPLPSAPSSVRVYQDAVGDWWASFVVRRERKDWPEPQRDGIGIDWGVAAVATTTDPAYDLPHPQRARRAHAKLTRYQRMMSRRKPKPGHAGSKGYRTAKRLAAKQHRTVKRQRQDSARTWARRVVRDHAAVAVEDFHPAFMARNRGLARKAADAAVGQAKRTLVEYANRAGRDLRLVPPKHTTMTCSACRAVRPKRLDLSERTFRCPACGYTANRDRNAARTILARAGLDPARADRVSRDTAPHKGARRAA